MMSAMPSVIAGRRERNKAEKRARITQAAFRLFTLHGYARTTTQQVAAAADVADGTVFRYAATKPELLLMVLNEELVPLLEAGRERAASAASLEEAVLDVLEPLIGLTEKHPDLAGPFLRELLFGEDGPHRRETLLLVDAAVETITSLLEKEEGPLPDGLDRPEAARWVFSALVSEVLRIVVGRATPDPRAALRTRVRVMLGGLGVRPVG